MIWNLYFVTYLLISINAIKIKQWTLINSNGTVKLSNITVPKDVYSALYQHSIIKWPLSEFNDELYRWVGYDNWTFISDKFPVEKNHKYALKLSQLDVAPLVLINDNPISVGKSEFVSQIIFVDEKWLNFNGENRIYVHFTSPITLAKSLSNLENNDLQPQCWPKDYRGECHINFLRKTPASFAWDWGPAIPTMGIRDDIELLDITSLPVKIKSIQVHTNSDELCEKWSSKISINLNLLNLNNPDDFCLELKIENLPYLSMKCKIKNTNQITFNLKHNSTKIKLWWPHEMGKPVLYRLIAKIKVKEKTIDTLIKYIGFRSVNLNQSTLVNTTGNKFEFLINCKPFYVRGVNYIPRTFLTLNWTDLNLMKFNLFSVVDAKMNTIRVSGTGKPEVEDFYEIADNLGLMIWHDLYFACAQYSVNREFLKTVTEEVGQIIQSLQYHPSTLIWSGNNEVEALLAEGWYGLEKMNRTNIKNYMILFNKTIRPIVQTNDLYNPFVLSSPSNGIESERQGGVAINPQSPIYGDVHYYRYSGDYWSEDSYPITRMTTEFGFQSLPSVLSWDDIVGNDSNNYAIDSQMMEHRQHHPKGMEELKHAILTYFGKLYPKEARKLRDQFAWFSYLTQINQAEILRVHINRLRSHIDYPHMNRGAMYWQLNDIWTAPTWSTIDVTGRWKLAHYAVKSAFTHPIRIMMNHKIRENKIEVKLILPITSSNFATKYKVALICYNVQANHIQNTTTGIKSFYYQPIKSRCCVYTIYSNPLNQFLSSYNCTKTNCLIKAIITQNSHILSEDTILIDKPKSIKLNLINRNNDITMNVKVNDPDLSTCRITLTATKPHLYVMLESDLLGSFSDNGFHILESVVKVVNFNPWYSGQLNFFNCSSIKFIVTSLNKLLY